MTEEQVIAESFRSSLDDVISVLEGIGPLCSDIGELIAMLTLAQRNDSQLALVMRHLAPKHMRR